MCKYLQIFSDLIRSTLQVTETMAIVDIDDWTYCSFQREKFSPGKVCIFKYYNKDPSFVPKNPKDVGRISSENALRENNECGRISSENALRKTMKLSLYNANVQVRDPLYKNVLDNSDDNLVVDVGHVDVGRISENVPEGAALLTFSSFWIKYIEHSTIMCEVLNVIFAIGNDR